jgi:hypothetical protein
MFIPDPTFSIPDPDLTRSRIRMCIKELKGSGSGCASKNLSIFISKKIRSGMFIPDLDFFSIPDPGVKKAADPGSATLTAVMFY